MFWAALIIILPLALAYAAILLEVGIIVRLLKLHFNPRSDVT